MWRLFSILTAKSLRDTQTLREYVLQNGKEIVSPEFSGSKNTMTGCLVPEGETKYCLAVDTSVEDLVFVIPVNRSIPCYYMVEADAVIQPKRILSTLKKWTKQRMPLSEYMKFEYLRTGDDPVLFIKKPGFGYSKTEQHPVCKNVAVVINMAVYLPVFGKETNISESIVVHFEVDGQVRKFNAFFDRHVLLIDPGRPLFLQMPFIPSELRKPVVACIESE